MKSFAELYAALDETNRTTEKVEALARYFRNAEPADAAWAVYFLIGRKPRQAVPTKLLRAWAMEEAGISDWLFDESYHAVGDLAETIALLLPAPSASSDAPLHAWIGRLLGLKAVSEEERRATVLEAWRSLDARQRFVWNKLISGNFRVGVSQQLVTRALAQVGGLDAAAVAHRLMGDWEPSPGIFAGLLAPEGSDTDASRPYPFYLATPTDDPGPLGPIGEWLVEWKWDGIRAQFLRRGGSTYLWSRGEELVTERFPEIADLGPYLPEGTVLDGEILPWRDEAVLPFAELQRRIGRKTLGKKILAEVPVVLMAFDLLEDAGRDVRGEPLEARRSRLSEIVGGSGWGGRLMLSPRVEAVDWEDLARIRSASRERGVEGLMLKRLSSPYGVGRVRGDWWKWKIAPLTVDAVLIAAQRGSGKRASLYTDYTFGVWDGDRLVPVAKAYSGLTDAEIRRVDAFVRKNTLESFGPVRSVRPELVFELAFEGIQRSTRHKSGVAVRFPRILRWRDDKPPAEADRIEALRALIAPQATPPAGTDDSAG